MAQDQQTQVKNILQELKDKKIAVTKIEGGLKISKGYLWKVKDGFFSGVAGCFLFSSIFLATFIISFGLLFFSQKHHLPIK